MSLRQDSALVALLSFALGLLLAVMPLKANARGVSPYLPLHISPEAERQIERLMVLAGDPVLTRPIPAARVHDALKYYCEEPNTLCRQVRSYLKRYSQTDGFTYANLELNAKSDESIPLPNQRGEDSDNAATINAQLYLRLNQHWYAFLGGERREDGESMEGTYSSFGVDWMQFDVGYRSHWLSPMQHSAMLWSTNAETRPSLTLSSPISIGSLGFRYELFATQLSKSDNIAYQGGLTSGNPCAIGMHLSLNPVRHVAFGLNRVMIYGGGERGECYEPENLLKAFFDPSGADNAGDNLSQDDEFGNQSASLTSRINVTGQVPFSLYFEYAGEDTSVNKFYRLGNAALQGGIYFPSLFEEVDLTYEYSEWQNSWYVHSIYKDGSVSGGNIIGHAAADQRQKGDGAGGRSSLLSFGWQHAVDRLLNVQFRTIQQASYSSFHYEPAFDAQVRYSIAASDYIWGLEGRTGSSVWDEDYYQVGAFVRW
ncbi:hypothetical protein A3742_12985 [Oleiphilus sp. HI0071]|uniref:capsule assembly Wzi family protein n=2 Tax=Oleiphilus TaxID=141450 RepID=UPI0007C1FFF4|nr:MULTISPECIES: capsule assembly Wzi family protein [unclassified Oleiphilus]KZY74485.1 hypothetical protein A3737_07925 [Oleiphilus sp. HI0065]KZY80233.1 hypothetical protein A3742_12985 [Oleiphilus sp. HI0071]KZY89171.1 hypothetical protein A3744_06370 [Oleiphilus sp. HI0073]KZZ58912.1 hypothetical protein A3760_06845 [Oleiphilus sp. HI0122]KZZ72705.1 hypothetical protein A3765_01835 [Oleiphilus sp. HI0130]KZZ81517.1 hypothetical protein A3767_07810 [Oleiphilus sp. HI0133]